MVMMGMILFLTLAAFCSLMLVFMTDFFWLWVMIDLSTIFLIPFLTAELEVKKSWFTGTATYFVVQFLGSASILYGVLIMWVMPEEDFFSYLMVFGFVLKLGLAPFHLWVPRCFINFHYGGIFMVGAAQKAFLILCMPVCLDNDACANILFMAAILSMVCGPVAMFNSANMKSFLAYSSITNTGYMAMCMFVDFHITLMYAFVYSTSMFFLTVIMSTGECDDLKSLGAEVPGYYKSGASALFLSFAGFPPLVDFCMKFLVLQECMEIEMWAAMCAVLVSSFINLLVWIWMLSFSMTGVNKSFLARGSAPRNWVNTGCVAWNSLGGLSIMALY